MFDYDIVVGNFAQSDLPGNEQRDFWGSEAAGREGSQNLIGVKSPSIDKLIDHVIFAKDRAELVAATCALDRVLQWNGLRRRNGSRPMCASLIGTATASPRCCRG